jgi:hypothetical protein
VKTTIPKDFLELLEVFSIALTNGLLDRDEVIKWADSIITKDSEPDFFIIELSLCGHKSLNDIISILNECIGQEKTQVSGRVILGFMYQQYIAGKITLRKVVGAMNWIVWEADLTDEEKSFLYGLEDNYECAEGGIYGTIEKVEKETLRFLEIYNGFQIDNFKALKLIDATIDEKIRALSEIVKKEHEEFIKNQNTLRKRKWWKIW